VTAPGGAFSRSLQQNSVRGNPGNGKFFGIPQHPQRAGGKEFVMSGDKAKETGEEVDALCPECVHRFKAFVDRLVGEAEKEQGGELPVCPVSGRGKCEAGGGGA
jgi:hypothetical protein